MGINMDNTDRCLQMFELTFDLSVMSYLAPLKGACVYTIPKDKIKFNYIAEPVWWTASHRGANGTFYHPLPATIFWWNRLCKHEV